MSSRQEFAGVTFDICTLEEAFSRIEEFVGTDTLNIVDLIDMKTILCAHEDENVKACLTRSDLVLPDSKEILQEAGILSDAHISMVEEHNLLPDIMGKAVKENRTVFLVSNTTEQMERLCGYLEEKFEETVPVSGTCILEECGGSMEHVVNEINAVAPVIVIALFSSPLKEQLMQIIYPMMNARLLVGIGEESIRLSTEKGNRHFYQRLIEKRMIKRQIQSLENNETK